VLFSRESQVLPGEIFGSFSAASTAAGDLQSRITVLPVKTMDLSIGKRSSQLKFSIASSSPFP
jgi:hypothetical protein